MNKRIFFTTLFSLIFLVAVHCSHSTEKVEEKFNVKFEKNLVIKDSDENLQQNFFFIRTLDVDEEGSIYVLDEKKILKFDKDGQLLWVIDQKGQGPGEFLRIVDLALDSSGNLFVADQDNRKVMRFSTSGTFLDEFRVHNASPINIAVDSKSFIYLSFLDAPRDFLVHKYNLEGKPVSSFLEANKDEKNPFLNAEINRIFFCVDHNDNLIVTFRYKYTIIKFDKDGKEIDRWVRELPFAPKKPKIVQKQPGWIEVVGDLLTQDIECDKDGNIFIMWGTQLTNSGYLIDVFSPGGKTLGNFYAGIKPVEDWEYFHIDNKDNLYIIDPLIEPKIFRFKMTYPKD